MLRFKELPSDIVPLILRHLVKPHYLAATSLVCKLFHVSAIPLLYYEVSIYAWHRDPKAKALKLFETLGLSPQLARQVHKIVIRDFHKIRLANQDLLNIAVSAIANLHNLRSCVWTRDGTMKGPILAALKTHCTKLRELEINGRHEWNYEPEQLIEFSSLESITLLMPNTDVVNALVKWCEIHGSMLKELTFVCKSTPVITDEILRKIAPYTTSLKMLRLAGCPKVTHHGVSAILQSCAANNSSRGIEDLRLESVSNTLDLDALAAVADTTLTSLHTFTLTFTNSSNINNAPNSFTHLQNLLASSPIRSLNLYLTGAARLPARPQVYNAQSQAVLVSRSRVEEDSLLAKFLPGFIAIHTSTLTRLAILRMPIPLSCIRDVCGQCPALEELFVVVDVEELPLFSKTSALARALRSIHVNVPADQWGDLIARGLPDITNIATMTGTNPTANADAAPPTHENVNGGEGDHLQGTGHDYDEPELESDDEYGFSTMLHSSSHSQYSSNSEAPSTNSTRVNRIEVILEALGVPAQLGPNVSQFGLMTRVWGVEYASSILPSGEIEVTRRLTPYESPRVPDAFLVMMT